MNISSYRIDPCVKIFPFFFLAPYDGKFYALSLITIKASPPRKLGISRSSSGVAFPPQAGKRVLL
jgi:hypothetical protein